MLNSVIFYTQVMGWNIKVKFKWSLISTLTKLMLFYKFNIKTFKNCGLYKVLDRMVKLCYNIRINKESIV